MMGEFKAIDTNHIDKNKWEFLLRNSLFTFPFQTPAFIDFCKGSSYLDGEVFAVENSSGEYEAACLVTIQKEKGVKGFFSRRAIIYGGPVVSNECTSEAFMQLIKTVEASIKNKVIFIEVRNYRNYSSFNIIYQKLGWNYRPYLNIKVQLSFANTTEILRSFKYNRRREIKLSINAGLEYGLAIDYFDVKSVYEILNDLYTQKVGLPVPPLNFFSDLWALGLLKVFIVKDEGKTVGGSFCLVSNTHAIYTFYYCGLRNYRQKTFPTHLAVLAAMEYGIQNRLSYLDFMGAGVPDIDYGVREYKKEFGGQIVEEGRYLKVTNTFLYWLGVKVINILKKKN
jgi:serine/alanine adding enzyme